MRDRFKNIARVVKARGKTGEVVVVSTDGLPLLVREGLEVCVVPPELKEKRWRNVVSCHEADGSASILLEGCATISDAEALKGRYLLAKVCDLPSDLPSYDVPRLLGREVSDAAMGHIGAIADVMFGPTQATWVVVGPYGEVLIPAVPEIVGTVPPEGAICVNLPHGLVKGNDD